jgi:hypothetical protein
LKAVFVAEVIGFAGFGGECVGEVGEVIATFLQFAFGQFGDAAFCGVKFFQYPSVLAQNVIDVAHQVVAVAVLLIIVGVAALVVTKFFIGTSFDRRFARKASFRLRHHY